MRAPSSLSTPAHPAPLLPLGPVPLRPSALSLTPGLLMVKEVPLLGENGHVFFFFSPILPDPPAHCWPLIPQIYVACSLSH